MTFVVFIPARLQSSRLPNKPLADIHGVPMVVRVARQAMKSRATSTMVATDSQKILDVCATFNVSAMLTREGHPSGSDRLAEACDVLKLSDDQIVVNVQGDEPLVDPELINAVADTLQNQSDCSMSSAAHAIEDVEDFLDPNVVKVVCNARHQALYFSRASIPASRDSGHTAWWKSIAPGAGPLRHIGIYAYRVKFLREFPTLSSSPAESAECLEQLRALWHGHRVAIHMTQTIPGPSVDTLADLNKVRLLLSASDVIAQTLITSAARQQ